MNQIKKNFLYNVLYQILILILPLITTPYVSRVLGAEGVGIFSYTYSVVYYFMIIGMLGINNYGNRTIAKARDCKDAMEKSFWEIYSIQFVTSAVMVLIYLLYIVCFVDNYKIISVIQILYIFSSMFNINWFFWGIENFKLTVIRNIIIKIISLVLIFGMVKDSNDIVIYTIILAMSSLCSEGILWISLFRNIKFVKPKWVNIKRHIKPVLILFISVIAISIYKVMDKIMLGNLCSIEQVGLYEQAEKIINIPLGIITALGTVMLPKMSNLVQKEDHKLLKKYIESSFNFVMFLAFPISLGIISISNDFIPIFLGKKFVGSIVLVNLLAITIIFISFANVIRTQYLIPKEKDKTYIKSVLLGAGINLIINILLIPKYKAIGACIGTIVAEFFVMFYQIWAIKKELNIFENVYSYIRFLAKAIIMMVVVVICGKIGANAIFKIIVQIFLGVIVYFILNLKYINTIVNFNKIFKKGR